MSLAEAREEIVESIQDNLCVVAGGYPIRELADQFELLASSFQALAACNLLLSLDSEGFFRNLVLSGFTRHYFLSRTREERNDSDAHPAISRTESFFDTVAAGAFELAQEIVNLSPDCWVRDGEYEDDFCYYFFFHNFTRGFEDSKKELLESILIQFEKSLEGGTSNRLDICRAFYELDQERFEEAFQALLIERQAQKEEEKLILGYDPTFEPRSHVFVEGLALLRLAEKAGFETEEEYQYCPHIARLPMTTPFPDDIYIRIDEEIKKR